MSDKAFRQFVLCYLLGEWVAGAVLDRRERKRIRRDAELRRTGYQAGYQSGYQAGYLQSAGYLVYVGRKGTGKSLIAAGDQRVPRSRRYW